MEVEEEMTRDSFASRGVTKKIGVQAGWATPGCIMAVGMGMMTIAGTVEGTTVDPGQERPDRMSGEMTGGTGTGTGTVTGGGKCVGTYVSCFSLCGLFLTRLDLQAR